MIINKLEDSFSTRYSVTLHLLLDPNFGTLNKLLKEEQGLVEENLGVETVSRPKSNYFLMRQPSNATQDKIKKSAKSSPLQYDSLVFGFKMDDGMNGLLSAFT